MGRRDPGLPPTILNEGTELVPLGDLRPFPGNARLGDVDQLCDIIRENGFIGFLVVNKRPGRYERTILIGNHRHEAAEKVGLAKVPVVWVDVDDERARKINMADNRASDHGKYDETQRLMQLREMLADGSIDDLPGIGYDEAELERIRRIVEDPIEPKAGGGPPRKVRLLVQCECANCGNSWTGYVDEDASVRKVSQRGGKRADP